MTSYSVSLEGLAVIRAFEGFQADPVRLPDGNWLVGHGHVRVGEAGAAVSEAEAADLLALDLAPVERFVNASANAQTQSQFDALVSFALSVGAEAFAQSQVLRRAKSGDALAAAYAMEAWRKSDVSGELEVVETLVRRRAAEKALYLKDDAKTGAPSAFLRAQLDHAASILGAPVAFAQAPAVGSVAFVAPQPEAGERLAEILKSEPATEALLLTQVVVDEVEEDSDEIVTAHAKPVARTLSQGRAAMQRAAEAAASEQSKERRFSFGNVSPQVAGLSGLIVLGLGLISMSGVTLFGGSGDMVGVLGAAALALPGVAAAVFGAYGLWRNAPVLKPVRI